MFYILYVLSRDHMHLTWLPCQRWGRITMNGMLQYSPLIGIISQQLNTLVSTIHLLIWFCMIYINTPASSFIFPGAIKRRDDLTRAQNGLMHCKNTTNLYVTKAQCPCLCYAKPFWAKSFKKVALLLLRTTKAKHYQVTWFHVRPCIFQHSL